tara:strand:+ start:259 stop:567 length:309 start_codon:yes stop_codon:yes gene_type:complete
MYRKDTFEVTIELDNSEEVMTDVYYTEDSTVTYSCEIMGEARTDEGAHTEVKGIDDDIAYENADGKRLELSEEDESIGRDKAFAATEEEAHEEAWEARYGDR